MEQLTYAAFREAVLDLSDEPSANNVRRYLAASRRLAASTNAAKNAARKPRRRRVNATNAR